ncbi:MAG: hypothetical protein WCG26_01085 [Chloroflexales bacterium]
MTPQALARLTELSNRTLVDQVTRIARRFGVTDALDTFDRFKPNIKNPAASMLRERELLSKVLEEVLVRLAADDAAASSPPPIPPRRTRSNPVVDADAA